jgi:hypothetical protein
MSNITQEYVVDYFSKNDKNIEELKSKVSVLEVEKALMNERNNNLALRINFLEQQVRDLNNTLMNHFAYGVQEYKRKNPIQDPIFGNNTLTTSSQGPPQGPILGISPPPGFSTSNTPLPNLGTSPTFSFPTLNPFGKN